MSVEAIAADVVILAPVPSDILKEAAESTETYATFGSDAVAFWSNLACDRYRVLIYESMLNEPELGATY
jgi:hypothetical protein